MNESFRKVIREEIAPLVRNAGASLLLGAGFSIVNESKNGNLPGGEKLRDLILQRCGKTAGPKTTLKDAYLLGARVISDFEDFFKECFTVDKALSWQENIFAYPWSRIYTTNIDNVLKTAHDQCEKKGRLGADFSFANYLDPSILSNAIGSVPVISIHGTCEKIGEGFIFSSLEYAKASVKILDWHRDLAAKIMMGGLVVIGNQLDESDIDNHLAQRESSYARDGAPSNYIVIPSPDEIKAANYESAGYKVLDCTAEEFFVELYAATKPRTMAEIVLSSTPSIKKAVSDVKAMTWFKGAFKVALAESENATTKTGILRHFVTGADPDWFYIVNDAHATTSIVKNITKTVALMMQSHSNGIGVLHVTGQSGCGKSTAIRASVKDLLRSYKYIYEFDAGKEIDTDFLRRMIEGFTEKSIFVFYSAAEYYFAINVIADRLEDHKKPYALFILEDRTRDHRKNYRQIANPMRSEYFEFPPLNNEDAILISQKIQDSGAVLPKFSEYSLDRRARLLVDKERGYSGDLLSALFSLTLHENFEQKIYEEYHAIPEGLPRSILDVVSILGAEDFQTPIDYIGGFLSERMEDVNNCLHSDLADVLMSNSNAGSVKCRHRRIAEYYFDNCIARSGSVSTIVGILEFLSRKFSVADIRLHPLPYRMYKNIISFDFLFETYYPHSSRVLDTEKTYHEAQRFFNQDGIFWLHFGRFYRKTKRWDEAIDCFKTGLNFYDSFQTKHSLGTALLEKYISQGCMDINLYNEGVDFLENERRRRGDADPYPTTTMFALLIRITDIDPQNSDAESRLKNCANAGFKHFADDEYFKSQLTKFMSRRKYPASQLINK